VIEGRPSISAQGMAMHRAAHQLFDRPLLLEDSLALAVIGAEGREILQARPQIFRNEWAIRAFTVARSRFAEDALTGAIDAGVMQYVVLAAGLDTSAYRPTAAGLRIIEVDNPATQAWKRARLQAAQIAPPEGLTFAPIDFEKQALADGLRDAGFRTDIPAFFSFLGAVMFLELATVTEILRFIGALPPGSGIVFDYGIAASALDPQQLAERAHVMKGLASIGEPVKTFFDPDVLAQSLRQAGFDAVEDIGYADMNARYFANRADDLRVGRNGRRLVRAAVARRER
jgi:methyltransferase (TIGR00027 family)